ncbi:MAG: DUF599 domain-containing protein [Mangrovicoccus sp.]|nr:DUF599 domain-containing protein [Mangrovicoccus sp.]
MEIFTTFAAFAPLDWIAVMLLFGSWMAIGWVVERPNATHKSVSVLMTRYRKEWLSHMPTRDPRVFDSMLMASLREGTAFFASACLIAIGGGLALLSNTEQLSALAEDFALGAPPTILLEVKILAVLLLITNAFFKFVWSNRVFGYCTVMMGAVPNDPADPRAQMRAYQAGELNIAAGKAFNRGLRSVYFALGALAWLIGSEALIFATAVTLVTVIRREYASRSRAVLLEDTAQ